MLKDLIQNLDSILSENDNLDSNVKEFENKITNDKYLSRIFNKKNELSKLTNELISKYEQKGPFLIKKSNFLKRNFLNYSNKSKINEEDIKLYESLNQLLDLSYLNQKIKMPYKQLFFCLISSYIGINNQFPEYVNKTGITLFIISLSSAILVMYKSNKDYELFKNFQEEVSKLQEKINKYIDLKKYK